MLCPVCNTEYDGRCHLKYCRKCGFPLEMWQACPIGERDKFTVNTIEPCKLVYNTAKNEANERQRALDVHRFGFDAGNISDIIVEEIDPTMGEQYPYMEIARYPQKYFGKHVICKCIIIGKEERYAFEDFDCDCDPDDYPPEGLSLICQYSFTDSATNDLVYLNINEPERLGLRLLKKDTILVSGILYGINKRRDLPLILVTHIKILSN